MTFFLKYLLLPILTLAMGICLGIYIRDFPILILDTKVKITDVIANILTLGVAVYVPLMLKKIIDDTRNVKNALLEAVKAFQKSIDEINNVFKDSHQSGNINSNIKENINFRFEMVDQEYTSLKNFIQDNLGNAVNEDLDKVGNNYHKYWKILTGNEIMKTSVKKIPSAVFNESFRCYQCIIDSNRKLVSEINKT